MSTEMERRHAEERQTLRHAATYWEQAHRDALAELDRLRATLHPWEVRATTAEAGRDTLWHALVRIRTAFQTLDRIRSCSPYRPWCDHPVYINDDHFEGHLDAQEQQLNIIAETLAAFDPKETNHA